MPSLPRNLSSAIDKVAREAVGRDWPLYATLLAHWAEIVGEDYARETTPVKIVFPRGKRDSGDSHHGPNRTGGILHIRLPQGLSMAFSFHSNQIRDRINTFFGTNTIEKIAFEPFYPEESPNRYPKETESRNLNESERISLDESVNEIKDNELRDALQKLGESVILSDSGKNR